MSLSPGLAALSVGLSSVGKLAAGRVGLVTLSQRLLVLSVRLVPVGGC